MTCFRNLMAREDLSKLGFREEEQENQQRQKLGDRGRRKKKMEEGFIPGLRKWIQPTKVILLYKSVTLVVLYKWINYMPFLYSGQTAAERGQDFHFRASAWSSGPLEGLPSHFRAALSLPPCTSVPFAGFQRAGGGGLNSEAATSLATFSFSSSFDLSCNSFFAWLFIDFPCVPIFLS